MTRALALAILLAPVDATAEEHVVREGETLAQIAGLYYGDDRSGGVVLAGANGLSDPDEAALTAGQRLVIPVPRHVTVAAGDTWSALAEGTLGLARRADVLARANGADPD